ncbi:hypothetical protein SAMN05192588_1217 [Nonlabens sp. Hel1_33_55]|nr:hypothetical protein SAMN05192588_1217 [Nonlabens sp. Hel1_33_55]
MGIFATKETRASLKIRLIWSGLTALLSTALFKYIMYVTEGEPYDVASYFLHALLFFIGLFLTSYFFLTFTNKSK